MVCSLVVMGGVLDNGSVRDGFEIGYVMFLNS